MKAVIAGGGIGGLTAALCLLRAGWSVDVLEQAEEIAEVGAGLQISPNGYHVLAALGLGDGLEAVSYEPERLEMRMGASGRKLFSIPQKSIIRARWGAPYLQTHRADLIDLLRDAVEARAPGAVRTGAKVVGYRQTGSCAEALLACGEAVECDVLVGADGVRSAIREQMLGPDAPRFTGNVAWRAVLPRELLSPLEIPSGACVWAGEGRHAVTYPLRRGELVNFVGLVERDGWDRESWTEEGRKADAQADFAEWSPLIRTIIEKADRHLRWALHDRPPLPRWSDGRVALLGDACHPMLPSLAQGACQAIEDGWMLAASLARAERTSDGVSGALAFYFSARIDRTSRIQKEAAANVRLFHRRGWAAQAAAYGPIWLAARIAPGFITKRNDWVYRVDVTKEFPL